MSDPTLLLDAMRVGSSVEAPFREYRWPVTIGDLRKLIADIPDDRRIFNDDSEPPAVTIHYSIESTVLFVEFTAE